MQAKNKAVHTEGECSDFAEQIRLARIRMRMTQKKFARFLGVTPGAVCNWEKRRNRPADERLPVIAAKLELNFDRPDPSTAGDSTSSSDGGSVSCPQGRMIDQEGSGDRNEYKLLLEKLVVGLGELTRALTRND